MSARTGHTCPRPDLPARGGISWDCPRCGLRWYARSGGWRLGARTARVQGLTRDGRPLR